jgi:extradiol dioxygenase family protein
VKKHILSTLFVGVDVSLRSQHAVILDFYGEQLASFPFPNNASGASYLISEIIKHTSLAGATHVVVAMESTSFYFILSMPPMYGMSFSGTLTVPSACW